MHGTLKFLERVRDLRLVAGRLRGVFHIAIGRRVTDADGNVVCSGVTWRELAGLLKDAKYDRELVRELGADPDEVSPKDREKLWYAAVMRAKVDGPEARAQADAVAAALLSHGWVVGPPPGGPAKQPPPPPAAEADDDETGEHRPVPPKPEPPRKKKKK